jgi:integrase
VRLNDFHRGGGGLRPEVIGRSLKRGSMRKVDGWLFPSEKLKMPLSKDNVWRRYIAPKLAAIGLGWVNFQVMRRTHASLMRDLDVDPKIVADQQGHTLDVNLNVYTQTSMESRYQCRDATGIGVGSLMSA